jgi:hypothetical protein
MFNLEIAMEQTKDLVKELDLALKLRKSSDFSTALEILKGLELQTNNPEDIATLRLFQATCLTDMGFLAKSLRRLSEVDKERLSEANLIDLEFELSRVERAQGNIHAAFQRILLLEEKISKYGKPEEIEIVARNSKTLHGILLAELGKMRRCNTNSDGSSHRRRRLGKS